LVSQVAHYVNPSADSPPWQGCFLLLLEHLFGGNWGSSSLSPDSLTVV
jgi:hypothetical protein